MKQLLAALPLVLIATAALAHPGAHMNPHADDPSWIPIILGSLAISLAALIWVRK